MIPATWRDGEAAVIGLGRSGTAAARLLVSHGLRVYASDSAQTDAIESAAVELAEAGVTVDVGLHDLDRIRRASVVIVSPGVPPSAPPVSAARYAQREILAELDLGVVMLPKTRLIVITGTNGKTTTTALVGHILREAGINAVTAGNIGVPITGVAAERVPPEWIAVEASSFQLHDSPHLKATIGVLTNLSPDHLDRYESTQSYYADKKNLFANATSESVWMLNADDEAVLGLAEGVPGKRLYWSLVKSADAWYDRSDTSIVLHGDPLIARSELSLLGDHNVSNTMAAALSAHAVGIPRQAIADAVRSFSPLRHRLEPIRDVGGVLWINDSKATNQSSTLVALTAMERCYVLIAGGRPKGGGYAAFGRALHKCRAVVAYGEAATAITGAIGESVPAYRVSRFDDAVERARVLAHPGDAVLLSPACASFDQFGNYEERGERFRSLVEAM